VDSSLNNTIGDDGEEQWLSLIADDRPNPEEVVIGMKDAQTRSQWLTEALQDLSDREQKIISKRHLGYETVTLEELGKELGVSKERVRQLEQRAMHKLKDSLSGHISNPAEFFG
jgi:RNA polymerase sigma-32 factor